LACFDLFGLELDRAKFTQWIKKFGKMEELVLEFEVKVEDNPGFKTFLDELQDKLTSMAEFKKDFMKFQLCLDATLKKVGVSDKHGQHSCTCKLHELWLISSICSKNEDIPKPLGHVSVYVWGWWVGVGWAIRPLGYVCTQMNTHCFLYCCIHKVDTLDEAGAASKLCTGKTHTTTMDFHLENFESTIAKYKAMLDE
jgi:hypothetical protein